MPEMVKERKHLIEVLRNTKKALLNNDVVALRGLSNETINAASVYQKEMFLSVAVMVYSLSKIYERARYKQYKTWNVFSKSSGSYLNNVIRAVSKDDTVAFRNEMKGFLKIINTLDPKFRNHVKEVMYKAKVHKASRLHEHGLSVGKTAELLGVSQFDVRPYVGQTGISDVKESVSMDVVKRLEVARRLFK